jgi:hypothetical protein
MTMCVDDKLYIAALYDKWIYHARKSFWWASRYQAFPNCPEVLITMWLNKAEEDLTRAWELGVHCDILTEEVRLWKAWRQEEARLEACADGDMDDSDEMLDDDETPPRDDGFVERMAEVRDRFIKLGQERSAKR